MSYNPESYQKKKRIKEAEQYRQSLNETDRNDFNNTTTIMFVVIVIIVLGILFLIGGSDAVFSYLKK